MTRFEGGPNHAADGFGRARLGQEVRRAAAVGQARIEVAGCEHDGQLGPVMDRIGQKPQAIDRARHADVAEDQIEGSARLHKIEGLVAIEGGATWIESDRQARV